VNPFLPICNRIELVHARSHTRMLPDDRKVCDALVCREIVRRGSHTLPLVCREIVRWILSRHEGESHTLQSLGSMRLCDPACTSSIRLQMSSMTVSTEIANPRNPLNRKTQIPRYKVKLNQHLTLILYREIPRNLSFSIRWFRGCSI